MGIADDIHNTISSNALIEREADFPFRHHLGASIMGHTCDRYLWFSFRWMREPSHSSRIQRIFNRGNSEEKRIIEMLRKTGLVLSTNLAELCANTGLPVELNSLYLLRSYGLDVFIPSEITADTQIKANFPPHLGGSLDAILHVPANYVSQYGYFMPVEIKTHNQRSFGELIKDKQSTRWNKPQHFVQGNMYATQTKCNNFLYVAENKNTDELYLIDEQAVTSVATLNLMRAEQIIYRQRAEDNVKTQEQWRCRMCDYKDICKKSSFNDVAINCRTCANALPINDGSWQCTAYMNIIERETEIERASICPHYTRIV